MPALDVAGIFVPSRLTREVLNVDEQPDTYYDPDIPFFDQLTPGQAIAVKVLGGISLGVPLALVVYYCIFRRLVRRLRHRRRDAGDGGEELVDRRANTIDTTLPGISVNMPRNETGMFRPVTSAPARPRPEATHRPSSLDLGDSRLTRISNQENPPASP